MDIEGWEKARRGARPSIHLVVMGRAPAWVPGQEVNMERQKAKGTRGCVFHSPSAFRSKVIGTNPIIGVGRVGFTRILLHYMLLELV